MNDRQYNGQAKNNKTQTMIGKTLDFTTRIPLQNGVEDCVSF
jgi:hypothetical protein